MGSSQGVEKAYTTEFLKDKEAFLIARVVEMDSHGLMGSIREALLDSFNLPIYVLSASELKQMVTSNGHFSIERMEEIHFPPKLSTQDIQLCNLHVRAGMEGLLSKHFGPKIIDQLFKRYLTKLEEYSRMLCFTSIETVANLFLLVQRNEVQ
ncbi:loganic acid O-methyltransferase-like [Malania oleifera]|uniref:loganic acid O-methyltransferase-like n=1 Tax=Malania oleifera TaxID=397392 RepID=UPI0025AE4A5D|nr:loganic acid O-methyltransferase-like [Malania oleifera]